MNSISLSRPNVQFQGWHQRTNQQLKDVKAGDTLFLRTINKNGARPENQVRYEAVKIVSIEGHQGRAYNPYTMSLTEPNIDSRDNSRSITSDSFCVTNQRPPENIDENDFEQRRSQNIPWDEVDLVTFVDSEGQQKTVLYGEYLEKNYSNHKSERKSLNVFNYDTQAIEFYTPTEFAQYAHRTRSNLAEQVDKLAAQLAAINGLFKGNLDQLVSKVLDTKVV